MSFTTWAIKSAAVRGTSATGRRIAAELTLEPGCRKQGRLNPSRLGINKCLDPKVLSCRPPIPTGFVMPLSSNRPSVVSIIEPRHIFRRPFAQVLTFMENLKIAGMKPGEIPIVTRGLNMIEMKCITVNRSPTVKTRDLFGEQHQIEHRRPPAKVQFIPDPSHRNRVTPVLTELPSGALRKSLNHMKTRVLGNLLIDRFTLSKLAAPRVSRGTSTPTYSLDTKLGDVLPSLVCFTEELAAADLAGWPSWTLRLSHSSCPAQPRKTGKQGYGRHMTA